MGALPSASCSPLHRSLCRIMGEVDEKEGTCDLRSLELLVPATKALDEVRFYCDVIHVPVQDKALQKAKPEQNCAVVKTIMV